MKRALIALLSFLLWSPPVWANSCAEVSTTTPLPSGSSSTWTSCGGTVPQNGDSVTVAYPLQINSNIPASGSITAFSVTGSTATVTWDGSPHTISTSAQIEITQGCVATGTGCATPYAWDTCTQAPNTATATGSASSGSTALTVSGVSGTIQNGMLAIGIGIAPGSTVTGSGTSWTLSTNTLSAVTGTVYFAAAITYTSTGLTTGQGIIDTTNAASPNYAIYGQVCNFLMTPNSAGSAYSERGQFGQMESTTFLFQNGFVSGGAASFYGIAAGSFSLNNVTQTGASGPLANATVNTLPITTTATGTSASKTIVVSSTFGVAVNQQVTGTNIPANTTVVSYTIYPGTSVTLSNFPTGTVTSATFTQSVSATNTTVVNSTSNGQAIIGGATWHPWVVSGAAVLGDSAGTYGGGLVSDFKTLNNSLGLSYTGANFTPESGTGSGVVSPVPTSASNTTSITNSAISGYTQDLDISNPHSNTTVTNGNFFSGVVNAAAGAGQSIGLIFCYNCGNGSAVTLQSSYDVTVAYGNYGVLELCLGTTATSSVPTCRIDHATMVGYPGAGLGSTEPLIDFGGDDSSELSYVNILRDSILVNNYNGIFVKNTSTFSTSTPCSNSVGMCNNLTYNQTNRQYTWATYPTAYGNGVDNGSTIHCNVLYGDLCATNPQFKGTTQFSAIDTPWIALDASLGGTGSIANMFQTVMAGRAVTGYIPPYTPAQVVTGLRAPFSPTNSALLHADTSGSYIGAVLPSASNNGFARFLNP